MIQELAPVLFGAFFTVATAWAIGASLLQRLPGIFYRGEARLFAFLIGSACLSGIVFLLCAVKLAFPGVFFALGAVCIGYALYSGADRAHTKKFAPLPPLWRWIFVGVFGAFALFYLMNAMAPESSADGTTYHLGVVARYRQAHGFPLITDNFYANLSEGVEMLFLFAFEFGRHSAAAMVHFAFWIALALMILCYGRRLGHPAAGVAAAIFTAIAPVVAMDGSVAYVDVALAAVVFATFYLLQIWAVTRKPNLLPLAGLLAGFAYAVKYTGCMASLYAVAFVIWKTWRAGKPVLRPALMVSVCALACILPWMAKNMVEVHNPISPFANRWFPNPYVHVSQHERWQQFLRKYELSSYRELPFQLTVEGARTGGFFGPLFLLAPLALIALRFRGGRQLLLAGGFFALTYFSNISARFLIPAIPFLALALALVLDQWSWLLLLLLAGHAVASSPAAYRYYATSWAIQEVSPRAALRLEDEATYLTRTMEGFGVARMIERLVPPGQRVFAFGPPAEAYILRNIKVGWHAGPNEDLQDFLWTPMVADYAPSRIVRFQFHQRTLRRLRVTETARPRDAQWSVSELRVFAGGQEIPRSAQWRLKANPNPWDVSLAFDNSPVTRWKSWQNAKPGMYIEIDFGHPQSIDSVLIETSRDAEGTKMIVEEPTPGGQWGAIAASSQESVRPILVSLRRAATEELKARDVGYLLVEDDAFGAQDFRDYPKAWGISCVGQWKGTRLYSIQ